MDWKFDLPVSNVSGGLMSGAVSRLAAPFLSGLVPWVLGLLAVGLVSAVAYHFVVVGALRAELNTLQVKLATLIEVNGQLTAANEDFTRQVAASNAKVQQLREESQRAMALADKAIAKARADSRKWQDRYNALWNAPPVPGASECEQLSTLVSGAAQLRLEEESQK